MSFCTNIGIWSAGGRQVNAINYDGTSNYLNRTTDLNGITDSPTGILSVWFNVSGSAGDVALTITTNLGNSATNGITLKRLNSAGGTPYGMILQLGGASAGGNYQIRSSTGYSSSGWHNLLASWNTNFNSGSRISSLYIDDVDVKVINADSGSAFSPSYTNGVWQIAANGIGTPAELWKGCLSELYFAPNQYLDFSVTANRRKFISAGLEPVDLGNDGSVPTGTQPRIYMRNPASSAEVNSGNGGDFVKVGSFTDCSTVP